MLTTADVVAPLLSEPPLALKVPRVLLSVTALAAVPELDRLVNCRFMPVPLPLMLTAPPVAFVLLIRPSVKTALPTFVPDSANPAVLPDVDAVDGVAARQHHRAVDQRIAAGGGFEQGARHRQALALANELLPVLQRDAGTEGSRRR